jgi:hypothetical protein
MRKRVRLCIELGDLKQQWDERCAERGMAPGDGVRQLIGEALGRAAASGQRASRSVVHWTVVGERRARIEIRLAPAELHAVEERAAASGFTANRWIVALISARLTGEPQFGEREMMLLAASNQELVTISRLLNQILRASDAVPAHSRMLDLRQLPDIKGRLDAHLRSVADLVRANLDRWSR